MCSYQPFWGLPLCNLWSMTSTAPLAPDLWTIVHLFCCRWGFYLKAPAPCSLLGFFHRRLTPLHSQHLAMNLSLEVLRIPSRCLLFLWMTTNCLLHAGLDLLMLDKSHVCHLFWRPESKASQALTLLHKASGLIVGPQAQVGSRHSETGLRGMS